MGKKYKPDKWEHYREAAKVIVGTELGFTIRHATIESPNGFSNPKRAASYIDQCDPVSHFRYPTETRERLQKMIISLLSGDESAKYFVKHHGEKVKLKPSKWDLFEAQEFAIRHTFDDTSTIDAGENPKPLIKYCSHVAKAIVTTGSMPSIIWDVAQMIKKKKSVNERQLRKALDDAYAYAIKQKFKNHQKQMRKLHKN